MEIWGKGTTRYGVKNGLEAYPGEPAINKENQEERYNLFLTTKEINKLALRIKGMMERGEDFRSTYEYYLLMHPYFGHRGWDNDGNERMNLAKAVTENIWYQLHDETVFTDQLWKNIEYAINTYDGRVDFASHAWITAKRLKQKQINDTKKTQKDGEEMPKKLQVTHMTYVDENGEVKEIDQEDDRDTLGQVEGEVDVQILIEKITDKFRQKEKAKFVLMKLVEGQKQSDIARMMVEEFGGKETTHAQFCSRLIKRVQNILKDKVQFNTSYVPKPIGNSPKAQEQKRKYQEHRKKYIKKFYNKEAHMRNMERKRKYAEFINQPMKTYWWTKEQIEEHFRGK